MMCIFRICILFSVFSSHTLLAHSFFNSRLLNKGEYFIDVVPLVSFQAGISENLQLGTSALMFLARNPNFYLKHRMFLFGDTETTFTSFTMYSPQREIKGKDVSSFLSLHGIITGYDFNDQLTLNAGIMRAYMLSKEKEYDDSLDLEVRTQSDLSIYAVLLGVDYTINRHWSSSNFVLLPFYADGLLEGDASDGTLSTWGGSLTRKTTAYKISATHHWDIFSMEFGFIHAENLHLPYISLLWSW